MERAVGRSPGEWVLTGEQDRIGTGLHLDRECIYWALKSL